MSALMVVAVVVDGFGLVFDSAPVPRALYTFSSQANVLWAWPLVGDFDGFVWGPFFSFFHLGVSDVLFFPFSRLI